MLTSLFMVLALGQTPPAEKPAAAAPYVKFEPQVNAKPGEAFVVKVDSNLVYRKWTLPPGLTIVPPEHTKYADKAFVCFGPVGAYRFKLEGTFNDQWAEGETVVFVGQPGPNPGPPGPGPAPGPTPDAGLAAELQRLYDADPDSKRPLQRSRLVSLWSEAAGQVVLNPGFATVKNFCDTMSQQSRLAPFFLQPDDLKALRARLASDLIAAMGAETTPLGNASTDKDGNPTQVSETRLRGKQVLERYAQALATVK